MKRWLRRVIVFMTLIAMTANCDTVLAASYNLNNSLDKVDYKVSDEQFIIDTEEDDDAIFEENVRRDFTTINNQVDEYLVAAKSYLIETGILDRPVNISYESDYTAQYNESWLTDENDVLKSDLYMMLYKIVFETINGNTLVFTQNNEENADKYYYYTASVYEQYLAALLDKGLLLQSDLDPNGTFLTEYRSMTDGSRPDWYSNEVINVKSTGTIGGTYSYTENSITRGAPQFFIKEDMSTIDALIIIEKFMRLTEKDMTETEASIVSYKYGVNYLMDLEDEEQATVSFLIAKGVLNFEEDPLDFYKNITYQDLWPILYRVAKEDARYDFGSIQLTDAESFWQAKGFASDTFEFTTASTYINETIEDSKNASTLMDLLTVYADTSLKEYTITKRFDTVNKFTYRGVTVSSLADMGTLEVKILFPEIEEIKKEQVEQMNNTECYTLTVKIEATNSKRAINIMDSRVTATIKDASYQKVDGVTTIVKGDHSVTMISQKALRKCFPDIDIIADKVLRETNSDTLACFLPDSGYVLVGNQVITDKYLIVVDTEDNVYYNLEVIASLIGASATYDVLGASGSGRVMCIPDSQYITVTGERYASSTKVEYLHMYSSSEKLYPADSLFHDNDEYLYNVNQISNGISTLYRTLNVDTDGDAKKEQFTVVVDWIYCVPDLDSFNASNWLSSMSNDTSLTTSNIFSALYNPPSEGSALREWWDSNYGMSNALANFIFGTTRVEYIKCGYMMPCVTILFSSDTKRAKRTATNAAQVMADNGFDMPSTYKQWIGGSTRNFLTAYFKECAGFSSSNSASSAFASVHRTLTVLSGEWDLELFSEKGESYGVDYYLTPCGVLYRNFISDTRITCSSNDSGELESAIINDVIKSSSNLGTNAALKIKGANWRYLGTIEVDGKSYLKVATENKNDFAKLKYKSTSSTKDFVDGSIGTLTAVKNAYSTYFGLSSTELQELEIWNWLRDSTKLKTMFYSTLDLNAAHYRSINSKFGGWEKTTNSNGRTTVTAKVYKYSLLSSTNCWKSINASNNTEVYAIPILYLPAGSYFVYKDSNGVGRVGHGAVAGALNYSSIYYSGIINGVIDSILAQELGTTTLNNVPEGSTVKMLDVDYTYTGGELVSEPIQDASIVNLCKEGNYKQAAVTMWSTAAVYLDGQSISLSNYVKSASLSKYVKDIQNKNSILMLNASGEASVYSAGSYGSVNNAADSVILSIKVDDSLLVRPIASDSNVYIWCSTATESIVNGISYPFYTESLSLTNEEETYTNLSQSSYEMTAVYNAEKEAFNTQFKKLWYQDFWTLLKVLIIVFASYLSVIGWVAYVSVTMGYGLSILRALAGSQQGGNRKGIDIIKCLSLGVYNVDEPPSAARIVIITMVCFIIIGICLTIL